MRNAYSVLKGLPKDAYGGQQRRGVRTRQGALPPLQRAGLDQRRRPRGERIGAEGLPGVARPGRTDRPGQRDPRLEPAVRRPGKTVAESLNALAGYDTSGEPNGPSGVGDHWVRIGPLKVFLDGGMLNGTAYMREPWGVGPAYQITEPEYRGLLFVDPDVLGDDRRGGRAAGLADDRAHRGRGRHGRIAHRLRAGRPRRRHSSNRRWLITHANFTSADNLRRCAELGVGADLQPAWIWKDTRTLLSVLGPRRMEWFHPYRKWLDAGLTIGGGSDHMIRLDPMRRPTPGTPGSGSGSP